jgi:hypothetical protein
MAHYAILDDNNIVTQVFVGKDEGETNWEEHYGAKRTSYNTYGGLHLGQDLLPDGGVALRKNYAGIGFTYDEALDAFIPPKVYPSWMLNEDTCLWDAPVPYPEEGDYTWDEDAGEWVAFE